jgi:hypothetical protein
MRKMLLALAACGLALTATADARDPDGRFANSTDKPFFQNWHNKKGVPCCRDADCHREKDGLFNWRPSLTREGYEIQIPQLWGQKWIPVEDYMINPERENTTGGAVACWASIMFCFDPGTNLPMRKD